MSYKKPYIPNQKIYSAVSLACKINRHNGNFKKAVQKAAVIYDIDENKIAEEIRKR